MVLGSEQGVIDKTNNTDSDLIRRQLENARGILDDLLAVDGLTAPSSSVTLSLAVDFIAASLVGYKPNATDPRTDYEVDGFKRSDGGGKSQIEEWTDAYKNLVSTYIGTKKPKVPLPRSTTS